MRRREAVEIQVKPDGWRRLKPGNECVRLTVLLRFVNVKISCNIKFLNTNLKRTNTKNRKLIEAYFHGESYIAPSCLPSHSRHWGYLALTQPSGGC